MARRSEQIEYGDFQTPQSLAEAVCKQVALYGVRPRTILEPTCGTGSFVMAAARAFPETERIIGLEINADYFSRLNEQVAGMTLSQNVDLRLADFFSYDWRGLVADCPKPLLVIGNLPWVTASGVGRLGGRNLPEKSNFMKLRGMEAKTGKSNFDIAEWMMLRLLEELQECGGTVAILLKTAVARRVLHYAWRSKLSLSDAVLFQIDAQKAFGASVDAGVLFCNIGREPNGHRCLLRLLDRPDCVLGQIAMRENELTSNVDDFDHTRHLAARTSHDGRYRWRSGIKHDCSKVLELVLTTKGLVNGYGEVVEIEDELVFPMMKGSSVGSGRGDVGSRFMIVPQRNVGDDTECLSRSAPRALAYLERHESDFLARRSSIYRGRSRFAVFGIGDYTFEPWKVAVCGLYKKLTFIVVGLYRGRPVVFDDTVYHLSCRTEGEARLVAELLSSAQAHTFYNARVFWDSKRPVTAQVLQRLDLMQLASALGRRSEAVAMLEQDPLGGCLFTAIT